MTYKICAKDPSGEFLEADWTTDWLPRLGDDVMLPTPSEAEPPGWQELKVLEVVHYPDRAEVWLGGTDGWTPGSVAELFSAACEFEVVPGKRS